jgi:hypothetical protein
MSAADDTFCKTADFRWREPITMASHLSAFLRCREMQRTITRRRRRR